MRLGIIGCGEIGVVRAAAAAEVPSLEISAFSDVDRTRADTASARYGGAVEPDWRKLVERADVDAVVISTPPHLHAEMGIAALESGKHVLCEKPLARSPAECRRMVEAADRYGRFLATGFNYRFYPSIEKARSLVDSGAIGEVDHIRSYAGYSAADHSHAWLHDAWTMGGGSLRDNGIHLIDLTRYFLGEVAEVKGYSSGRVWSFPGCEDNGFALLRSNAGRIASLHASWTEWRGYKLLVEVYGTRGCIRAWCFPMLVQLVEAGDRGRRIRRKFDFFPKTLIMEHVFSYRWVVKQSFVKELKSFSAAVGGAAGEIASGLDGLRAVEIAHEAARGLAVDQDKFDLAGEAAGKSVASN